MQRIEREPAGALGGIVAALVGRVGVAELMAAQADEHGEHAIDGLIEERDRLLQDGAEGIEHRRFSFLSAFR